MTDRDSNNNEPVYQVEDDEGLVAREKKKMIIESRKHVNEVQMQLILSGTPTEVNADSLTVYLETVRQFLRNIEPLLSNSDVQGAKEAYHNAHLGHLTITPPVDPNTKSKPDHLQNGSETPEWSRNNDTGLVLHRFSDPVKPETFEITGLKEIILSDGRTASWDVVIDKKESRGFTGGGIKETTVRESKVWDKPILNNAVRVADQFLDNANIGFSLTEGDPDDGFLDL